MGNGKKRGSLAALILLGSLMMTLVFLADGCEDGANEDVVVKLLSVEQIGGEEGVSSTTALKLTFGFYDPSRGKQGREQRGTVRHER